MVDPIVVSAVQLRMEILLFGENREFRRGIKFTVDLFPSEGAGDANSNVDFLDF